MSETWTCRIKEAIRRAETLEDIDYIEDKIHHSPKRPNYRTNEGREIKRELLKLSNERAIELINIKGLIPF